MQRDVTPRPAVLRPETEPLSWPLDPKELEERLWRIDIVSKSDYPTDDHAFQAIKAMAFRLRLDIAKATSRG